ncbi:hypothetical protein ACFX58_09795 [Sphingomonas sp. NCPPB 2930]
MLPALAQPSQSSTRTAPARATNGAPGDSTLMLGTVSSAFSSVEMSGADVLPNQRAGSSRADRRYVYAGYDSGSSGYSPADGRGVHASLDVRF